MSRIEGPSEIVARLAAAGIHNVEDVLRESECVRDLPDRSNHVLRAGGLTIHVKRRKRAGEAREALCIDQARGVGVPTAQPAFDAVDPTHGALTGTLDLAPAEPLDDLLRQGLDGPRRVAVLRALAEVVAALHDAGLHHRDLYLCHVFVRFDGDAPVLALIDLERMGRHRRLLSRRVVKDLAALRSSLPEGTTTPRERARFLLRYRKRRGLAGGRASHERLARRVRRKAERISRHVPRTPVGDAARPGGTDA